MVAQSFFATDNNSLMVDSSPNGALVGNPIINNSDTPDGTVFTFTSGGGTTITVDDTSGNANIFEDDQEAGHSIIDGGGIVANGTTVEAESLIFVQALDGGGSPTGPVITITVFSQNGVTGDVWGFATDIPLENGVSYVKTGGSNIGSSAYTDFVTCFGTGTLIRVENGLTAVEDLSVGDKVWTHDNGYQPIKWISSVEVEAKDAFAPIHIEAGVLNTTSPLILSPEHRILVGGAESELLFGESTVLVAAKHLVGLPGVTRKSGGHIRYHHFMFEQHEIVEACGALCESFFFSQQSLSGISNAQRAELLKLFPSVANSFWQFGDLAAVELRSYEAKVLRASFRQ